MSDQDVQALVAYMDQLPPVRNPLPKTELPAAVLKAISGVPRPVRDPLPPPNPSNQASTGEYLATIAYCEECHTPQSGRPRSIQWRAEEADTRRSRKPARRSRCPQTG